MYNDMLEESDYLANTSIHTKLTSGKRLSSIYRKYSNINFESWAWETFLWEGDVIEEEFETFIDAADVVNLHAKVLANHMTEEENE